MPTRTPTNLRRLREDRGLSTRQLAALVGVHQSQVVRWENGTQSLYMDRAIAVAGALGVGVAELMAPAPEVPNSIRHLRLARGLTQAQLAAQAGVDQGDLSRWETGSSRITLAPAVLLAHELGVSVEALGATPTTVVEAAG